MRAILKRSLNDAWDKACCKYEPPEGKSAVLVLMKSFIQRRDVRPFFYLPADSKVYCEKEFVNACGDTRRIDRLIIGDKEVWIVDFKLSGGVKDEYQRDMEGYVQLLKAFYPQHEVSGHILYIQSDLKT